MKKPTLYFIFINFINIKIRLHKHSYRKGALIRDYGKLKKFLYY